MAPEQPSESQAPGGPPSSREDARTRDSLARVRTVLANERTLLAYIRTALALFLAGASILHFLDGPLTAWSGMAMIALGSFCLAFGAWRFRKISRQLAAGPER